MGKVVIVTGDMGVYATLRSALAGTGVGLCVLDDEVSDHNITYLAPPLDMVEVRHTVLPTYEPKRNKKGKSQKDWQRWE